MRDTVERALAEDLPWGDVTSELLVPPELPALAVLVARQAGVVAGLELARATFRTLDPALTVELGLKRGGSCCG